MLSNRVLTTDVIHVLIALAVVGTAPVRGQTVPSPTAPRPVNASAVSDSGIDEQPDIAGDGHGHWVAVWSSTENLGGSIGADRDILVARSNDNGVTWSIPATLNSDAAVDVGSDFWARIVTDGAGRWLTAWVSNNDLSDLDIRYATSTDNGLTWSNFTVLNSNGGTDTRDDAAPTLVLSDSGTLLAAWHSAENLGGTIGTDNDVLFASSANFGTTWTAPIALNANATTDTGQDTNPRLATDMAGRWLAAWQSTENLGGGIGTEGDILMATSSDDGGNWSAPSVVNSTATADSAADDFPTVLARGDGAWTVAWHSSENVGAAIGTDRDILATNSVDGGATWSNVAALNANAATDAGDDFLVELVTLGHGDHVAIWYSADTLAGTIGGDIDLLAASAAGDAAGWSAPTAINANAATDAGDDSLHRLAHDGFDRWLIAWMTTDPLGGTVGSDSDIVSATFALPDCNANNVGDRRDIAAGTSTDCNGNDVPDECEGGCSSHPNPGTPLCFVLDTDDDGVNDCDDRCANTPIWAEADSNGCACTQRDDDDDGVDDCADRCANEPDVDSDEDGVADCVDACPQDPAKFSPGTCGCDVSDTDTDGDGTPDCVDACPDDPANSDPETCAELLGLQPDVLTGTEEDVDSESDVFDAVEPTNPPGPMTDQQHDQDVDAAAPTDAFCGSGVPPMLAMMISALGLWRWVRLS